MSIDDKTLAAALRPLGRTTEGVRKKLIAAGAKGRPEQPQSCSIAEYLKAKFPREAERISVDANEITVNGASVFTGSGLKSFICAYDDWAYPELIKHTDECSGIEVVGETDWEGGELLEVLCGCGGLIKTFYDKAEASTYARRARRSYA